MTDKRKIVLTAVITAVITAALSITATSFVKDKIAIYLPTTDAEKAFSNKIRAVEDLFDSRYLYDYDKEKLRDDAIAAYVEGLEEPYTHYYSKPEFAAYMSNVEDGYVGIGVIVGVNNDNKIEVIAPFEDSPAYKAGIMPGDILKAVDGTEYDGDSMNEAVDAIKSGKEGTEVSLTIVRSGSELDITVTRENIVTESVKGEMLDDNIGYIRITGFNMKSESGQNSTSTEFDAALSSLEEQGMERLIIDLRDNPGGVLDEVCAIADKLMGEGTIVYTETKSGEKEYINSDAAELDMPIAVLINENSASASEVLTGALKDSEKAVVVGKKSYGKGIVQDVYPFYDGSGVSLTSAKYYTPGGTCIHGIGIEPDISVEMPEEYNDMYASEVERDKDPQLQKAIEAVKERE